MTEIHRRSGQRPAKTLFVDFEGIDGSGKTSLSNRIADYLREQGYRVHHVRDKGVFKSEVSKRIRSLTRDPHLLRMGNVPELLLYVARDAQMVEEYIMPRLKEGAIIFCDRYFYSSISHSHFARGVDRKSVEEVIDAGAQGIWPDLVVYCDIDTLTSKMRKRVQKIHNHRFGDFGRKGLMGLGFRENMRQGYLKLAEEEPDKWVVVDNAKNTFEESLNRIYAAISDAMFKKGFDRPEQLTVPSSRPVRIDFGPFSRDGQLDDFLSKFWETVEDLSCKQPGLGGVYLVNLDLPEAYAIRDLIVEKEPEVVAYGLKGLKSPPSMEYRYKLVDSAPFFVARSLTGMKVQPQAMELRKRLAGREPGQVALSLRGLDTPEAWGLRRRLRDEAPREVIAGLRGVDSEEAWKLREKAFKKRLYEPLAESLTGFEGERAWQMREAMAEDALPWVLMSLRGCNSGKSWQWRFDHVDRAPKIIVRTIGRKNDPRAWQIRERVKTYAKEVLDSVAGLDTEPAWRLRSALADRWPNTSISSLGAGNQSTRAWRFRWELMAKNPDNLLLAKHIVKAAKRAVEDELDED